MKRTAITTLLLVASGLCAQGQKPASQDKQLPSIKELVERLKKAEKAARSVSLKMATEGFLPGGVRFTTTGSLRVHEGTHFHVLVEASFADGLKGMSETVRTPRGVWMRQTDPIFGEIFVVIPGPGHPMAEEPSLLERLDEAGRILGGNVPLVGGTERAASPLGSSLLEDLNTRFELVVKREEVREGQRGYRLIGDLRPAPKENPGVPLADRVELFVRERDGAILEMVDLEGGQLLSKVSITDLVVDLHMDPASFAIDPKGKKPRHVREHTPLFDVIEQVLEEAAAKKKEKEGKDGGD